MHRFVNRFWRAAKLDVSLYQELVADPRLLNQALIVVFIFSMAAAYGTFARTGVTGVNIGMITTLSGGGASLGVDIRDGPNLGCIQCGLCIDACDTIMTKLHRPTRLIAYDTDVNIRSRLEGQPATSRFVRPRTLLYSVLIVAVGALMLWTLATRAPTSINVIHDRNPEYVLLTTGGVRNAYTLRILNKHNDARRFAVSIEGLTGASLEVVGAARENGENIVDVGPDQTREVRAIISTSERVSGSEPIVFAIRDLADDSIARAADNFRGPNAEGDGQ